MRFPRLPAPVRQYYKLSKYEVQLTYQPKIILTLRTWSEVRFYANFVSIMFVICIYDDYSFMVGRKSIDIYTELSEQLLAVYQCLHIKLIR